MKMHYTGVWGKQTCKIEIDEADCDEIADIHARMNNHTDEKIRDAVMEYLESDSRKWRLAMDNTARPAATN